MGLSVRSILIGARHRSGYMAAALERQGCIAARPDCAHVLAAHDARGGKAESGRDLERRLPERISPAREIQGEAKTEAAAAATAAAAAAGGSGWRNHGGTRSKRMARERPRAPRGQLPFTCLTCDLLRPALVQVAAAFQMRNPAAEFIPCGRPGSVLITLIRWTAPWMARHTLSAAEIKTSGSAVLVVAAIGQAPVVSQEGPLATRQAIATS